MSYTPPGGSEVAHRLAGQYSAPEGDAVPLRLPATTGSRVDFNLVGDYLPPPGGAVNLELSEGGPQPQRRYTGQVIGVIPVGGALYGGRRVTGRIVGTAPTGALSAAIDINVFRGLTASRSGAWQQALPAGHGHRETFRAPAAPGLVPALSWTQAEPAGHGAAVPVQPALSSLANRGLAYAQGLPLDAGAAERCQSAAPAHRESSVRYDQGTAAGRAGSERFQFPPLVPVGFRHTWQDARPAAHALLALAGQGRRAGLARRVPWEVATQPRPGRSVPPVIEPPIEPPCYLPPPGGAVLLAMTGLYRPPPGQAVPLVIACGEVGPPAAVVVPARRVYIVLNTVEFVRLPERTPIPLLRGDIAIDPASWGWSFTGSVPGSARALVMGDGAPAEVEVRANGVAFRFVLDRVSRERTFGSDRLNIGGRSRAAYLDERYSGALARVNASEKTAQQLALDELEFTGWDLDWRLPEWLVPPGAWSFSGDRLKAISAIVGSVNGLLRAHRTDSLLIAERRYPVAPWAWGTAPLDVDLPLDVVMVEGVEWLENPAWNAIHVSGQTQGLAALVKRAGTPGDTLAPAVVDPLITGLEAARERGLSHLAEAGKHATVTLTLPLMPAQGLSLLEPGKLIRVNDPEGAWRGLVRGTRLSLDHPRIRQAVTVERYYG